MLVVDASCLGEVLVNGQLADSVRLRLSRDSEHAAPHVIDVEVFGVIRRLRSMEAIDETTAALAVEDLSLWPGERFGHRALLERAWELRATVPGWDAMYVALAEVLEVPLITLDGRLARATGPRCVIELILSPRNCVRLSGLHLLDPGCGRVGRRSGRTSVGRSYGLRDLRP